MAVLSLTEKLNQLGARYDELTQELSSAEIVSDSARFQKVAKQQSELGEIVAKHREFKQIEKDLAGAHQMFLEAEDAEMKPLFLPPNSSACIPATPKRKAGKSKSWKAPLRHWAASRKSWPRSKDKS